MDSSEIKKGQTVQSTVMLDRDDVKFPSETYALLTVIVNDTHATFYRNIEMLGVKRMPRPVTDCFNDQAGVLVGDADMELGQLRFYPKAMTSLISVREKKEVPPVI